jgi:hypothetical protein
MYLLKFLLRHFSLQGNRCLEASRDAIQVSWSFHVLCVVMLGFVLGNQISVTCYTTQIDIKSFKHNVPQPYFSLLSIRLDANEKTMSGFHKR